MSTGRVVSVFLLASVVVVLVLVACPPPTGSGDDDGTTAVPTSSATPTPTAKPTPTATPSPTPVAPNLYGCELDGPNLVVLSLFGGGVITSFGMWDAAGAVTVDGCNGLAWNGTDMYVVVRDGNWVRYLGTVDRSSGAVTVLGVLSDVITELAFDALGALYGVSGQDGGTPDVLYRISTTNGALTNVAQLGGGGDSPDGEALCYNPMNERLFRMSGNDPYYESSVDPSTGNESVITTTQPFDRGEPTACTWDPINGVLLWVDWDDNWQQWDSSYVGTTTGQVDNTLKGLAFAP